MKRFIYIVLLLGIVCTQTVEIEGEKDSTFIFLKSGQSIKVNKLDASFKI